MATTQTVMTSREGNGIDLFFNPTKLSKLIAGFNTAIPRINLAEGVTPADDNHILFDSDLLNYYKQIETNNLLNLKSSNTTGAAASIVDPDLIPYRVVISDLNGKILSSDISVEEVNFLAGASGLIHQQLNGLSNTQQDNSIGAATTIENDDLLIDKVPISSSEGNLTASGITVGELHYLFHLNSNVQSQIDSKYNSISNVGGVGVDLFIYTDFVI